MAGPPRLLVVASTFRILDNYIDSLRLLTTQGWDVRTLLLANNRDPDAQRLDAVDLPVAGSTLLDGRRPNLLDVRKLRLATTRAVRDFQPEALFCTSASRWPQGTAAATARKAMPDIKIIAGQHGFVQPWDRYLAERWWDKCLLFGELHRRYFPPSVQEDLIVAGLPKIERLLGVATGDDGYIVFAAQDQPPPEAIRAALKELEKEQGVPVRIRPHPQYPHVYDELSSDFAILPAGGPYAALLARARLIVTTASTVALEAMAMRKLVLILPSEDSEIYAESGCVADSLSTGAIQEALRRTSLAAGFLSAALQGEGHDNVAICARRISDEVRREPKE